METFNILMNSFILLLYMYIGIKVYTYRKYLPLTYIGLYSGIVVLIIYSVTIRLLYKDFSFRHVDTDISWYLFDILVGVLLVSIMKKAKTLSKIVNKICKKPTTSTQQPTQLK